MQHLDKVSFLKERIPSSKEVEALKRHYLLGGVETELLLQASKTLQTPSPHKKLVDWAYSLLKLHEEKPNSEKEVVSIQEKVERILALFSNQEDLQRVLQSEKWSLHQRRSIDLVAHFVANEIPLITNFKIVDKVHHILENAYLPIDIAQRYFGKTDRNKVKNRILEEFLTLKEKKPPMTPHSTPQKQSLFKRYTYLLGAGSAIVLIFMAGFLTAKLIYEHPFAPPTNMSTQPREPHQGKYTGAPNSTQIMPTSSPLANTCIYMREKIQKRLKEMGVKKDIDFDTKFSRKNPTFDSASRDQTTLLPKKREKHLGIFKNPHFKMALKPLVHLVGLTLPPTKVDEASPLSRLPTGFEIKTSETPTNRLVYVTNGENTYPMELYSFIGEPTIMQYRLISLSSKHFYPVVTHIWRFSRRGHLYTHRHFIYQKNRLTPEKTITDHFLTDGSTIHLASLHKKGKDHYLHEYLVERKEYLPSGKLLYTERNQLDKTSDGWRTKPLKNIWYDDGHKIYGKHF